MLIRCKSAVISIFFLLTGVSHVVPARGSEPVPRRPWPLPIAINLTSSFAEYRSGHFHAGLDIKTYGREGVPAVAVGDGYVSRLRASPDGYGKAVYLTLDSGEIAVYAHLAEFSPQLEQALYDEQISQRRYRVDIYPEPDRFRFVEGEVLAYTGRTGTSAPHLHFEFRDRDQNPLNPLSQGWIIEDKQPPAVRGVVWVPLDKGARIEGTCRARDLEVKRIDGGTFAVLDTVHIQGRVGIGAHIVDRLNNASGRLAPHRVELSVDGVLITALELERFSYGHTGEVELAYDMERVRTHNRHFLFLFRREGETLWNRWFQDGGVIDPERLPAGADNKRRVHVAIIRTTDRAGNVSVTSISFTSGPVSPPEMSAPADRGLVGGYFFGDLLSVEREGFDDRDWTALAALSPNSDATGREMILSVADVLAANPLTRSSGLEEGRVHLVAVRRGERVSEDVRSLGAGLSTDERSLYSDAFVYLSGWSSATVTSRELNPKGAPVLVGPASLSLKRRMELRFALTSPADGREAVYSLDERKQEWQYNTSEVRSDTVYTGIGSPGVYGVFVDTQPPQIARPALSWRKSYATGRELPEVAVGMVDEGSGIDPDACEVRVNGEPRIARWDGFAKKMFVLFGERDGSGTFELSIVAVDRAGNQSKLEHSIELSSRSNSGGTGGNLR